jgi:predicted amino acid dehydrogenase
MTKFAFVIHPLDFNDVEKFEPKVKGKSPHLVEKVIEWMPPFKFSEITGIKSKTKKTTKGYFIVCPFLPKQILNLDRRKVLEKITQSGKFAEKLGAKILGLGAYTSIVGNAGKTVAKSLKIGVTTGSSYTIASSIDALKKAAKLMDINIRNSCLSIIGATGSIGRVCSLLLSKEVEKLIICARQERKLFELKEEIKNFSNCNVKISIAPKEAAKKSNLIITATSTPYVILKAKDLKKGSIVLDISRPRNISYDVAKKRKDVLVIEGGVIRVPGKVNFNYDFGFPKNLAYACMSETIILALENKTNDYSIGRRIQIEKVQEMSQLAKKHGFKLGGFRSFDRPVSLKEIEEIKNRIKKKIAC